MKNILRMILLVALAGQLSINAMDQERADAEKRALLAGAAQARINPQPQQPAEQVYDAASLAGLPIELQENILLSIIESSPTLKEGIQNLLGLARTSKQFNELSLVQLKRLIQQRNQQVELDSLLFNYSEKCNIHAVKLLLKLGADVHATESSGKTALMWSYTSPFAFRVDRPECLEVVEELLKEKANVNATDKQGITALMYAVINNHIEIVRALIRAGADINVRNSQGITALDYAHSSSYEIRKLIQDAINKR